MSCELGIVCQHKHDCKDLTCPGRPDTPIVIRQCEGGERVSNGVAATACHYCDSGVCRQMVVCQGATA
jgi:hypothetical protein